MSAKYRCCVNGCGRLIALPHVARLPTAWRALLQKGHFRNGMPGRLRPGTKLYRIDKVDGLWKFVANAHHRALTEKPKPGEVVAAVILKNGKIEARVFEKSNRRG